MKDSTKYNKPEFVASLMLDKKALDVQIFDVRKITTLTDYFIICTSESEPQTNAIKNHIEKTLKEHLGRPNSIEGISGSEWILMDYFYFVIHIFSKESREFYNLESIWGDAKIKSVSDKGKKK